MSHQVRIAVEDVSKRFGSFEALRGCSLRADAGETIGLAGPNGAGKSTLARIMAGFARPSGGSVRVAWAAPPAYRAAEGIGYLPEELPRMPGWTVLDLLRLRRLRTDAPLPLDELVARLAIEPLLRKPLRVLSKGQLRLAGAAYALLGAPAVVVLDEPDAGLDVWALDRLADALRAAAAAGSTLILLSHQMEELERVCARIAFLFAGRVVGEYVPGAAVASPREVYRSLAEEFGR